MRELPTLRPHKLPVPTPVRSTPQNSPVTALAHAHPIAQLQKVLGNQATGAIMQRQKKRFRPKEDHANLATFEQMADKLDSLTTAAHTLTLQALQTDNPGLVKDEGVTTGHYTNWLNNPNAMTTGYVIEDMVTQGVSGAAGYSAQETHGNARPDFVLRVQDQLGVIRAGVVDITSSKEAGHVLQKDFNLANYAYVAEAIYPSINFSNIKASNFTLSAEDEELIQNARMRRARETFASQMGFLKQQLDLLYNQSFLNKEASQKAGIARAWLAKIKTTEDTELIHTADQAILEVRAAAKTSIFTNGYVFPLIHEIIAGIKARYEL